MLGEKIIMKRALVIFCVVIFCFIVKTELVAVETGTPIGNFSVNEEKICKENGRPIIYFFGSESCPHCRWEKPIFEKVAKSFEGYISFHENIDNNKDMDVFGKYSQGGIPTLVLGCKYYREGSGEQVGEVQEIKDLTDLICKLTGSKPESVCAVNPPSCSISYGPNVIKQGETTTEKWSTKGPISYFFSECSGVLKYIGGHSQDYTDPEFLKSINAQELINGTSNSGIIKPSKIGEGSCTITLRGPGGASSCSATVKVVANDAIDEEGPKESIGILAMSGALRDCPSLDCKIIRYYIETAEIKIVGLDDSNEWYQVKPKDDYGKELNGWMYYSLFTKDFRKFFSINEQPNQESTTSESTSTLTQKEKSQEKFIAFPSFLKNKDIQVGFVIIFVFIIVMLSIFLFRQKIKAVFRLKWSKINLSKIKFKQKSFVASLSIILVITVGAAGISYGAVEYRKTSKIIGEAQQLVKEEKYSEANEKLEFAKNSWFIKNLGIRKREINNAVEKNKKLDEDKLTYNQGLDSLDKDDLQEAINLLAGLSESSFYYQKAQTKTEEAKRKMVEGELSDEKTARNEAEKKKQIAEAQAKQQEFEKKLKEQQLAGKEAEEKMMNADNDGDGLTYREEQKKGTSDWNVDFDNDGINDKEDLHPAGGGRNLAQDFTWSYQDRNFEYKISIPEDLYEYYKNQRRGPHGLVYVTVNDIYIKKIAEKLKTTAKENGYHGTSFLVSFIQSLPYVEDYYTSFDEYPKYPIETLIDRNGDCEDTSYLFASLVGAMNLGVALIEFNNHMGVGVNTVYEQSGYYFPIGNERYYYYETTGEGFVVGELPELYKYQNAKITVVGQKGSQSVYPQYKKPCDSFPGFSGYYSDGSNYYSDSQCNYQVNCLPWSSYISNLSLSEYYYNPQLEKTYHDSSCTQLLVKGCYKSKSYSDYFYKSGIAWYYDSQCTRLYQSMTCNYPYSYIYSCISENSYSSKKSTCDYYASSEYLKDLAQSCYDGLDKCRGDINEYQTKLNEYNSCLSGKEY